MPSLADTLSKVLDTYKPPVGVRISWPVEYLWKRGVLDPAQYSAANAFRADYECAVGESSAPIVNWQAFEMNALTENPDLLGGRHKSSMRVARVPSGPRPIVDARKVMLDLRWSVGSLGFQLLRGVCGLGIPIVVISREIKLDKNITGHRLREALWDAAEYYGFNEEEVDAR
jgi:hypothetical protein